MASARFTARLAGIAGIDAIAPAGGTERMRRQQAARTNYDHPHHDHHPDEHHDYDAVDDSAIASAIANRECAEPQRAEFVLPPSPLCRLNARGIRFARAWRTC